MKRHFPGKSARQKSAIESDDHGGRLSADFMQMRGNSGGAPADPRRSEFFGDSPAPPIGAEANGLGVGEGACRHPSEPGLHH